MASKSKLKGTYHEKKIETWINTIQGFEAERQPLSGSLGGKYRGDIKANFLGHGLVVEVKYRTATSFPSPFTVLKDRCMAIYKRKTGDPQTLVIMTDDMFKLLIEKAQNL